MTNSTTRSDYPSWLSGMLRKRSLDAIKVMADLVQAGLANGVCSANDVRSHVSQPNVIEGIFKLLPHLGFENTGTRISTSEPRKHKRRVDVYALANPRLAAEFVRQAGAIIMEREALGQIQEVMDI